MNLFGRVIILLFNLLNNFVMILRRNSQISQFQIRQTISRTSFFGLLSFLKFLLLFLNNFFRNIQPLDIGIECLLGFNRFLPNNNTFAIVQKEFIHKFTNVLFIFYLVHSCIQILSFLDQICKRKSIVNKCYVMVQILNSLGFLRSQDTQLYLVYVFVQSLHIDT